MYGIIKGKGFLAIMAEIINLWRDESVGATLTLPDMAPYAPVAPAMLVIPGGGYGCVCMASEGTPIAARFTELGYRCFILTYRVKPYAYPAPLQDAVRAMKYIRGNAAKFRVNPAMVAAVGFSAGGHLAASLGTLWDTVDASDGDALDAIDPVPNAIALAYPVITGGEKAHRGSVLNWVGHEPSAEDIALFSLEKHVTEKTPPTFLWSTIEDNLVPCENALLFFEAMRTAKRPCDLHIFPHGHHGMQMGYGRRDIALWPEMARNFTTDTCGFAF